MTVPDDSALLHGRPYDPVKAREYYLRTRQLKGRRAPRLVAPKGPGRPHAVAAPAKKKHAAAPSYEAERHALEARLNRLRDILAQKVKEAKARSGVKSSASRSPKANAAKNHHDKAAKPLTAKQKRDKAQQAKEAYRKDHPQSQSQELDQLRQQIADIRAKIAAAIKDAQRQHQSHNQTASKSR